MRRQRPFLSEVVSAQSRVLRRRAKVQKARKEAGKAKRLWEAKAAVLERAEDSLRKAEAQMDAWGISATQKGFRVDEDDRIL